MYVQASAEHTKNTAYLRGITLNATLLQMLTNNEHCTDMHAVKIHM